MHCQKDFEQEPSSLKAAGQAEATQDH
jgi:hypothetical protein